MNPCFHKRADFDGDGVLSRQEIKYWTEKHVKPMTEAEQRQLLTQFDHDKDEGLDFEEFLNLCSKLGYKISPAVSLSAALLQNHVRNDGAQDEKLVQKSHSYPSSSGELPGNDADEGGYCPICTLKAVKKTHLSNVQGCHSKRPTRRQVSSRFLAQISPDCTNPNTASTTVRQIINYFEAQVCTFVSKFLMKNSA